MWPDRVVDARLVRAYRRLIRFYPPGPRRDELLDTLAECAAPGRRRPAVREAANLIVHGTRARLGRPKSHGVVVLALFIALAGGFLGACGANRLGWHAVGSLPVGAEAAEIRNTVFPGLTVWGGGDAKKIVRQGDGEGVEYGYALSWAKHTPVTRDVAAYTADTRDRLEAAGWTVTSVDPPLDETDQVDANPGDRAEGFTVVRGGLALHFADYYWPGRPPYDSDGDATFLVWHRAPWSLSVISWIGALLGAAIAWLLTGWVSRRTERIPGASGFMVAGAVFCLLGLLPAALYAIPSSQSADETEAPFWEGLVYLGQFPALLSGVLALLILVLAFLIDPMPWRRLFAWMKPLPGASRTGGPAARWPKSLRRRPALLTAIIAVGAIVAGLGLNHGSVQQVTFGTCTPAVPSGIEDPPSARMSYLSRVYLDPHATDDQRNLAQAAIGRGFGGGFTFDGGPRASGFAEAFCAHGRIPEPVAESLPWYWTVDLASPGLFGGLAAEVITMPGVVAVQHVTTD